MTVQIQQERLNFQQLYKFMLCDGLRRNLEIPATLSPFLCSSPRGSYHEGEKSLQRHLDNAVIISKVHFNISMHINWIHSTHFRVCPGFRKSDACGGKRVNSYQNRSYFSRATESNGGQDIARYLGIYVPVQVEHLQQGRFLCG